MPHGPVPDHWIKRGVSRLKDGDCGRGDVWGVLIYRHGHIWEARTHALVSLASFCMISMIMRQAAEQPSGVEWMVMGFSAAPAFSFR